MEDEGAFYEDLTVGTKIKGKFGRTVTDYDNIYFTLMTMGRNQVHYNKDYTSKKFNEEPFNKGLVFNGFATLAIADGLVNEYTSSRGFILSIDGVKFKKPVFSGDTIYSVSEVVMQRPSKSRPRFGIVEILTKGFNQRGENIIEYHKTFMAPMKEEK